MKNKIVRVNMQYKDQETAYHSGYNDCRDVLAFRLRKILEQKAGHRTALVNLLVTLDREASADHWRGIQEEFPGITREEYEASLDETADLIRTKYYNAKGYLKLRLVGQKNMSDPSQ